MTTFLEAVKRRAAAVAVERVFSLLGHELSQPLNVITMASFNGRRMAIRDPGSSPELEARLLMIETETRRAAAYLEAGRRMATNGALGSEDGRNSVGAALVCLVADRLKRRGIRLSVTASASAAAPLCDCWLLALVILFAFERLEASSTSSNEGGETIAECSYGYSAETGEWQVQLAAEVLDGGGTGLGASATALALAELASASNGRFVVEAGRWTAVLPAEALS